MAVPRKGVAVLLKSFLRWAIVGGTLFFLAQTLREHWQEVATLRLRDRGWLFLLGGFAVTLVAHIWSGWVWSWILREFNQSVGGRWAIRVYLKTNIAKYLPGNVWHFYGRAIAVQQQGVPLAIATVSVLLEPLLMAAAALIVIIFNQPPTQMGWALLVLPLILLGVHPWGLNPLLRWMGRRKRNCAAVAVKRYPLLPLLGEIGFLGLRGTGFVLAMLALSPVAVAQTPQLVSAFSLAWLLGLVIPGAPGGLGVFESTAIALLDREFSPGAILGVVALYRLVGTLAEVVGAALSWLHERWYDRNSKTDATGS